MSIFDPDCPPLCRGAVLFDIACLVFKVTFSDALAQLDAPRPGSIITLSADCFDEDGEIMEADRDVVVLKVDEHGRPLVSYEHEDGHRGLAWLERGE